MTPGNSSVKMSSHEKGDSFIQCEGAIASDGVEPGRRRFDGKGRSGEYIFGER
jgi:hypothetical protein